MTTGKPFATYLLYTSLTTSWLAGGLVASILGKASFPPTSWKWSSTILLAFSQSSDFQASSISLAFLLLLSC